EGHERQAQAEAGEVLQGQGAQRVLADALLHDRAAGDAGLGLCLAFVPFQPFEFEWNAGFLVPALWMGVVVSVGATLLLYRLIAQGNLVNVTSLFYLVPAVTAIMDFMVFGNRLGWLSLLGMGLIVVGLMFVFRKAG
ncbi:DMT family transporter, partial [Pseudomonas aeruginosa]|uniref:DMT family transporter n=1 Tax=Pseudomonas aeruginosa TaxID=287 RepID=UPI002340480A